MSSSQAAIPYIGSKISLVTNSELRYEGILVNINTTNSTVTLKDVRMSGTENRKTSHFVMPSAEVFDYIIFNGRDIKDLTVSEPSFSVKEDPAVVAVNVPPSQQGPHMGGPGAMGFYRDHPGMPYGAAHPAVHEAGPMQHGGFGAPRYHGGLRGGMAFMSGPAPRGPRSEMYGGYGPGAMRGGYNGRGGMRGGAGGLGGSRQVVGELAAQPNSNLKTQVEQAFNFEEANQKFEKGAKTSVAEEHPERENIKAAYNRGASFFDSISCEALNRQQGRESRVDREKQRELDTETFGPAATLARGTRYYRRGYRRPMGGRGGPRVMAGAYNPNGNPMLIGGYGQRMPPMGYAPYGMGPVRAK